MFDHPAYFHTLAWLGAVRVQGRVAWLERPVPWGGYDARGSWPYGGLPDPELLSALIQQGCQPHHTAPPLLSWTGVIRPDLAFTIDPAAALRDLRACPLLQGRPLHWRVLKWHAACLPDLPSPRCRYSRRTISRIRQAESHFQLDGGWAGDSADLLAELQNGLRQARGIPRLSSPDHRHFLGLQALAARPDPQLVMLTLRHRATQRPCGALVLVRSHQPPGWHAHSALCTPEARRLHANYLLFDSALTLCGDLPLWWGGQPAGSAGQGLWRFKSRFANHASPAHLLSLDLHVEALRQLRSRVPAFPWLPNYRDPALEMAA